MKKILVLALMFTGLSISAFSEKKIQIVMVDGPVTCVGGMTTCGIEYRFCFPQDREVSSDEQLEIYDEMEARLCP
ncbi:MAG TPA: hypothetical protein VEV16_11525 [Daejeonella sp.]|nr:hypothetical protein [Daejeonella sp.]